MDRRLAGQTVLVTRSGEQAQELRQLLVARGATVLEQPGIYVSAPDDWQPVDAAISRLKEFDWVVFSSSNGVHYLIDRLQDRMGSISALALKNLAAIGPGTAAAMARYGLVADVIPSEYRAEALADALVMYAPGKRFLLARANRGRDVLPNQLIAAGAIVEQIVVYGTYDVTSPDPQVAAALSAGGIQWVTVTSSAIARAIVGLFGEDLRKAKLASISPVTTQVLCELGYAPKVEARDYTMPGLVAAIVGGLRREFAPLTQSGGFWRCEQCQTFATYAMADVAQLLAGAAMDLKMTEQFGQNLRDLLQRHAVAIEKADAVAQPPTA